jgi:simple sugar transport system permease protein
MQLEKGSELSRRLGLPQVGWLVPLLALVGALLFTALILLAAGVAPLEAYRLLFFGVFTSPVRMGDMVMLASPLLLCAAGLTLTFATGLYNLGIEGQMALGAICALIPMRLLQDSGLPPTLLWTLAFICAALGGALWAALVGGLRLYARVSEIFAGLGLNFLASGLALYLVAGPWRRPGTASITSSELLPNELWLPTVASTRLAPIMPLPG